MEYDYLNADDAYGVVARMRSLPVVSSLQHLPM